MKTNRKPCGRNGSWRASSPHSVTRYWGPLQLATPPLAQDWGIGTVRWGWGGAPHQVLYRGVVHHPGLSREAAQFCYTQESILAHFGKREDE